MKPYTLLWLLVCVTSCTESPLNRALKSAGAHRGELEKVLHHYAHDSLKLEAAKFIIANMPGSFSQDPEMIDICQPFYAAYDSLAQRYDYQMTPERGKKIDSLWNSFVDRRIYLWHLPTQPDLTTLSSSQLIEHIDLAFAAWQTNAHTRHTPFEEFCEYILPYRQVNGMKVDDARKRFYDRHHGQHFTQPHRTLIDEADSLLYQYRHLTHSQFWGTQIPILSAATFEQLRHGLCEQRCGYNAMLFTALGVSAAVDFVPAWGNRNNSHTWNVLIHHGQSYAFESFWDDDRWKYKRIYNNLTYDHTWGRFRLAKVYRRTFKNYIEGPIADPRMDMRDIPELFKSIKKKDVSHEYFDTTDVTLSLTDVPHDAHYAYLCVFNYYEWQPMQWGKIEKGRVTFKGMGKDIVYLPCYYRNGALSYAAEPFLLNAAGEIETFRHDLSDTEDVYMKHYGGHPSHYGNIWNMRYIAQSVITGSTSPLLHDTDTLCILPDSMDIYSKKLPSLSDAPMRFLRVSLPQRRVAYSDLSFYYKESDSTEKRIEGISLCQPLSPTANGERPEYMFDAHHATGYKHPVDTDHIEIDLGGVYRISSIGFTPYLQPGIRPHVEFELFYWHNGWQSLGNYKGATTHIVCRDVPKGALLLLKHENPKDRPGSRPFIYQAHEAVWY